MIFLIMSLRRAHVANAAVAVLDVVPINEAAGSLPRGLEIPEANCRELGSVFRGAEQHFGVRVVADARSRVRRLDPEPMQHGQNRGGLERGSVVAVQHGLVGQSGDPFGERRAPHQMRGMLGGIGAVHFPADDLAAVEVQDQMEPAARGSVPPATRLDAGRRGHA